MANFYQIQTDLNQTPVTLQEDQDKTTGFSRDIILRISQTPDTLTKLHCLGIIRHTGHPTPLIDELTWILGTHIFQLYEDFPNLLNKHVGSIDAMFALQQELSMLKRSFPHNEDSGKQTLFKYHLVDILRQSMAKNDLNQSDELHVTNTIDHALKACLNYIDDFDYDAPTNFQDIPDKLSLKNLYQSNHLRRLTNQTASTITKLLAKEPSLPQLIQTHWLHQKPSWSPLTWGGLINLSITASLALILFTFIQAFEKIGIFAIALSLSNPILVAIMVATLSIAIITYLTQLTPIDNIPLKAFLLKTFKSFLTLATSLTVLIHFFYPFNFLNLLTQQWLGTTLAIASSINIVLTILTFTALNQMLTHFTEPRTITEFPKKTTTKAAEDFIIFRSPYRNRIWQLLQKPHIWKKIAISCTAILGIILITSFNLTFTTKIITAISTVFSISSLMAILALLSLFCFGASLLNIIKPENTQKTPVLSEKKSNLFDIAGMLAGFAVIMSYVLIFDFTILENVLAIIGNIFNFSSNTIMLTSGFGIIAIFCVTPFLIPKDIDLQNVFSRNPVLQAEHIFLELNEFYYLYGIRHPIVMMIILGLFVVAFASFYNHIIPSIIAGFAYKLAIALINSKAGTGILAFTSSLMIGNIIIIAYDFLTSGKRSYLAKLSRFWELYPLDVLAASVSILIILNLFILIPYIQSHLGTVAMIGSLSFLFKVTVILYDFYRDRSQKSFIASILMMLLWPFIALRQFIDNPTYKKIKELSRALERSIIHCLLTMLYDIPFKIILRITEVLIYAAFNVLIYLTKVFGEINCYTLLVNSKKTFLSYFDYFRISSRTTLFANENNFRLWHLLIIIGSIWLSIQCIASGLCQITMHNTLLTSHWLNPMLIINLALHNQLIQSLFLIQFGWAIALLLITTLIRLTNVTHGDLNHKNFKNRLYKQTSELFLCTLVFSSMTILLGCIQFTGSASIQISLMVLSLFIQSQLSFPELRSGISYMIKNCNKDNRTSFNPNNIKVAVTGIHPPTTPNSKSNESSVKFDQGVSTHSNHTMLESDLQMLSDSQNSPINQKHEA